MMASVALVFFLAAVSGWWLALRFWRLSEEQAVKILDLRQQVYEGIRGVPGLLTDPEFVRLTRARG